MEESEERRWVLRCEKIDERVTREREKKCKNRID